MLRSLCSASLFLAAACSSAAAPSPGPISVTAQNATLRLENFSGRAVFYFIYEREAAALINWAPCVGGSGCTSLPGGGQAVVPYTAIGGYAPGKTEAIVWWWSVVQL